MENKNDLPCCCFSDNCQKCSDEDFKAQQKATRKRRLTIPDFRRDAGPGGLLSPALLVHVEFLKGFIREEYE